MTYVFYARMCMLSPPIMPAKADISNPPPALPLPEDESTS